MVTSPNAGHLQMTIPGFSDTTIKTDVAAIVGT
jgi:hypothetical protein